MKVCPHCFEPQVLPGERCTSCQGDVTHIAPRKGTDLAHARLEGKYELIKMLGEGGMAWVYQGLQRSLGRRVAVKLMKPMPGADDRRTRRFIREATTAARLMHPHIVTILDSGVSSGGLHYIVTEYLDGESLGELIYRYGAVSLATAVSHLNQVLAGVEHAHEHGVIHRDLKPDNIMLVPTGRRVVVKVLDFGIAWTGDERHRLTAQGEAVGTPAYMSPEQIRGNKIGAWTDVYALGVILFEMLTGQLPFDDDTAHGLMRKHLQKEVPAAHEKVEVLPEEVSELIRRAMAKDPKNRFGTVAEFREALLASLPNARSCLDCCDACHHHHEDPLEYCPSDSTAGLLALESSARAVRDATTAVVASSSFRVAGGDAATPMEDQGTAAVAAAGASMAGDESRDPHQHAPTARLVRWSQGQQRGMDLLR